ncbi:retron St85 family RNA-directed DNA polymerase [Vibrio parahaemolyticus]|nr:MULTISPECIES: retron St85 family RNA-directed DNA polymerase [Vibrio]EHZ2540204.1 retron St85 family RNA-directed DNA polymerase [Vibrio parahaemolyticus]EJG0622014.1 retron St85 family RNA-directed DNA polymerase [Vibrio parahaemolyticus]EJG0640350.1 retron St85 family RNA-directed DNA polymerase [Vibrio parahaemolyticus]EJG0687260.1 retron St85 family RNA-directed DNA polymerase [Vibrio parahaemolyticus]EJG0795233.1 retron St85 family RNA-directed DNA polymerase [Vibrio parahaemolyticus]
MKLSVLSHISPEVFPVEFSHYLAKKPSGHYKVYKIPKRTFGFRVIAQPTPELKRIQRAIVEQMKPCVQIHSSAKAYVNGINIKENASVHVKSSYLLKLDLENFFNSLTPSMLLKALNYQDIVLVNNDIEPLIELLFWNRTKKKSPNLVLSVGAPSSPFLSNFIMYEFDKIVTNYCTKLNINYSRYADDLTFSTSEKNLLFVIPKYIENTLRVLFDDRIKLNRSKTFFSSKAHNRHVTGITISNNNKLSLGRDRKRYIRALLHKFSIRTLDDKDDIEHLKGLIGFAKTVEPIFLDKMKNRYGEKVFIDLFRYNGGD